jgi:hypothetical protein
MTHHLSAEGFTRLTRIAYPLLERFLQATHVERFGRHADQRHDLQEFLFAGVTELLHVVAACNRRTRVTEKGSCLHMKLREILCSNTDWDTDYIG